MAKRESKSKPRRQVVLIIVEGQSDENALLLPLTEAFEAKYGDDVIVHFARIKNDDDSEGGDITSRNGVQPDKLQMLMNKLVIMPCLDENSLMPKYVTEIVHIVDIDGIYVDDAQVVAADTEIPLEHPVYEDTLIRANDPVKLRERNVRKRANIEMLLQFQKEGFPIQNFYDTGYGNKATTKVHTVPYSLYYFSCNLDHFIVNDRNLDSYLKVYSADLFARKYGNSLNDFIEYIRTEDSAVKSMSYQESWDMLKEGNNSLSRFTNIGLLLKEVVGDNVFDFIEKAAG